MIVEDQFGVGDVIDVGEATGTVEAVTLRVTRLRDINGTVWYVPNGEILRVGNMSQNWSRAVVDVSVAYSEDLTRVKRVLAEVAHDLWDDEDCRELIIEEPEVTGVEMLAADSVNLRVMIKTLPMEQWAIARELRQRIKARFDHEGIEIPFAQRVVWHREEHAAERTRARSRRRDAERPRPARRRAGSRRRTSAWLTGQPSLAAWAAATKSSSLMPSTVPRTVRRIWVMPVPGTKSTSAVVSRLVGGVPALARPLENAIEKQAEWAAAMQLLGAGLAVGLLGPRGPGDVVGAETRRVERGLAGALEEAAFPVGGRGASSSHGQKSSTRPAGWSR